MVASQPPSTQLAAAPPSRLSLPDPHGPCRDLRLAEVRTPGRRVVNLTNAENHGVVFAAIANGGRPAPPAPHRRATRTDERSSVQRDFRLSNGDDCHRRNHESAIPGG
jgi:hypothetical protein